MFQSFDPRRSQVRGSRTGVKTLFWHLIPRRSHTSRDLSRSQETFETEFRPSPQSSQRESDRSQNAILASHPSPQYTSRDLSRSQETFGTVSTLIIASSAISGQEHETHLWQICVDFNFFICAYAC
ncbi:hypothetical protein M5D96_011965 [Drosophila gunungcola]|uniref:Uncharacterized protein n=1 Tax=Drosophila gunungcola TaxID=103775 RepID=A0A9P9YE22_9MUSC|nr:hypothetical protein M5D96_011965 [Drosophila gunungcola]